MIKRKFHHYEKWEDWRAGMYRRSITPAEEILINRAAHLLRSPKILRQAMLHCAFKWKYSAEQNLSNRLRNRQAWLGQAACCHLIGATEELTKLAWHQLTVAEQDQANGIADEVIELWEKENA